MSRLNELLRMQIEPLLARMQTVLPEDYRLTVVARNVAEVDADILITADDLDEVLRAIQTLKGEGS